MVTLVGGGGAGLPGLAGADAGRLPRVTVYGAEGCHLCESALRVIDRVRAEVELELVVVDITADPELEQRYRERIPVVLVDGEEAFTYWVHADKLVQKLDRRRAES